MPNIDKIKSIVTTTKNRREVFTDVTQTEKVSVKHLNDLIVQHHYLRDSTGELWVDFDHPLENVQADFAAYRQRLGLMSPQEIYELRSSLGPTVREFSEKLGLGSSTVSQIENNQRVQTGYQDNLFKWAKGIHFNATVKPDNPKT
ncbi:hypothetical protein FD13_GL001255 [Levilactobacillus senmaizukei DSM 21775 = NBRC 103853]|uniref:HTH cro/C1-type domain-containing protein n=1 Tax=Levilactobacillus senmaizukei DSM 21775 = NBRC 103853 TaxID=1423803 RepID=A0A0R2DIL4_9LACO|nr:helix-turn-helix domain-containing protein [Levilactobacillus senmaizukei]KRN02939.1 hypothetical protein FD13_GL001255 [Levilactobacillus senmaizukei DSM 21775 = NBRC 103853]